MARRIRVMSACAVRCSGCTVCRDGDRAATLEDVLAEERHPELVLGGGDATRWPALGAFLALNAARDKPQRIVVEAPATALTEPVLAELVAKGVSRLVVQIDCMESDDKGVAETGRAAIGLAEWFGLDVEARVAAAPGALGRVSALAAELRPRRLTIELGPPPGTRLAPADLESLEQALLENDNLCFGAERRRGSCWLPPCLLQATWHSRPSAWSFVLRELESGSLAPPRSANAALPACAACALSTRCGWQDGASLSNGVVLRAAPVDTIDERLRDSSSTRLPIVPRSRREPRIACVTPWTTLELTNVEGFAHQCCSTWTIGDRGNVKGSSLLGIWNGAGFQHARRSMASADLGELCRPICPWLADRRYSEDRLQIRVGSEAFVRNQLLVAEDVAERREVVRGLPLYAAICAGTYCNYDCIMCLHGRTPRRDLPDTIWDELPELMPTLGTLTLLGGEPLANPLVMRFLRDFERTRWPDVRVNLTTNGSLLTPKALAHLRGCSFGDVAISLNAGTAEVYERVQRGLPLDDVLANIDALIEFRRDQRRFFRISVVFVVQTANAHTLLDFGGLAHGRGLDIRLLPLNPRGPDGLDYYDDEDVVAKVLAEVDRLGEFAARLHPEWLVEVAATREAIAREAASRRDTRIAPPARRLPLAE